ncbi:alpha/beta fold hydrolase [Actinomadura formosensis]|uniref:alpha/beta fold hydrolase n=1 Tax=Actinomadura formosensis TaxID=60706 RepID=UPI000A89B8F1|nr:alpha/beta fold hydrolase [Actinomadura formosensis]
MTPRVADAPEQGEGSLVRLGMRLNDAGSLIRAVPHPLKVAATARAGLPLTAVQRRLDLLTRGLGLPRLDVVAEPGGLWAVELAVSRWLALEADDALTDDGLGDVLHTALTALPGAPTLVRSHDGSPLRCWTAGPEDAPAIVLVGPCGMPVGLMVPWMRALSRSFRVVTWESRGLFTGTDRDAAVRPEACSLAAQAGDLAAVLDGFGIGRAHAIGLCGGATVALAAAATSGAERITSLSLWHGDYELGSAAPKTVHQQDMTALLKMASRSVSAASGLQRMMRRPEALDNLRPDIAHHLIYPYATPEILHRYGLLNGSIMAADSGAFLSARQPALVVTSREDSVAHPAGSEHVAARLPRATLAFRPDGDHLSAFDAAPGLVAIEERFLQTVGTGEGKQA